MLVDGEKDQKVQNHRILMNPFNLFNPKAGCWNFRIPNSSNSMADAGTLTAHFMAVHHLSV
jgi:hypothetical protein